MNPALPLLVGLGGAGLAAGLIWTREGSRLRELALAFAVTAFAGTALLAPALAIPDGIPSPAATLAAVAPWQGTGETAGGNPLLGDVIFQIEPWLLYLRGELRAGRLPFWNPHQFSGAPFWANGQSAPLFPLHLLFAALPLQLGFVLLPWLRLAVAGGGVWLFARELGLSRPAALISTLIFPLSGMMVSFLLFPMGNALALVPWVFWAVERLAAGGRATRATMALAICAGLLLLAGHPETAVHAAILSAIYLAVRGGVGGKLAAGPWLRFAAGWGLGGALAAVQLLPLAATLPETSRWQHLAAAGAAPPLATLLTQPLRLVLPGLYGHPALGTWWGPFNYSATAVYAGALALPLAAAALGRLRGDRRILALVAVLGFSFVAAYHLPGVRELLAALPVVGRMAHHRLIFGIELALALLAGAGCDAWLAGKGRGMVAGSALALGLLAVAVGVFRGEWAARGLLPGQLAWAAGVAIAAVLAALSLRAGSDLRWRLFPFLPALLLGDLLLAHGHILGALPVSRLYPETPAVRFLAGKEGRVAGVGNALRPNAAMVYGLHDVRGDDPVKLERYERVYARAAPGDPVYFQPLERWREPWLDRLGLRWVMAPPGKPGEPDWSLAYDGTDARVFERPGALPLVRFGDGGREAGALAVRERAPGLWRLAWETPVPRTVVVAETFDRGWRATVAGRAAKVAEVEGLLLGVEVGPGKGELELRHRPVGFVPGAVASLVALAVLIAMAWRSAGPKGRQNKAWGASPRKEAHPPSQAPEGRQTIPTALSPRWGLGKKSFPYPGLAPWATCCRPSGPFPRESTHPRPGNPAATNWRHNTSRQRVFGQEPALGQLGNDPLSRPPRVAAGSPGRGWAGGKIDLAELPLSRPGHGEGHPMTELRPTEPGDLPALSRLFADRFGHPLELDQWQWKYRQIPGEARSLVAVAPGGEITAHAGALMLPARWSGGEGGIWQLVDFAGTASRHGLKPPLVELGRRLLGDLPREGDVPWIFGFPSERHFRLGERVFGYRPVGRMEEWAGLLPSAASPAGVEIVSGDSAALWPDAAEPEAIWSRAAPSGIRRSAAFLNWRYHARPRRYYRFYRMRPSPPRSPSPGHPFPRTGRGGSPQPEEHPPIGKILSTASPSPVSGEGTGERATVRQEMPTHDEGFAVFAFVGDQALGAELFWLPGNAGWYPSMLAVALDLAASGIRSWRFWAPASPEMADLFTALGLAANGEGSFLGCRGAEGGADPAPLAAGFIHAMGDYDFV